jgi:predicted ATPase
VLDKIHIENFKVFNDLHLKLRPLTVLTGFNSGGKSTAIQALLLAHLGCRWTNVPLNGPYGLALGGAYDVLNFSASEPEVRVTLTSGSMEEQVKFTVPDDRAVRLTAETSSRAAGREPFDLKIGTYLSAERLGPRDLHEVPPTEKDIVDIGEQGQFTAHILSQRERTRVSPKLRHPQSSVAITLGGQVEAWLSDMVRPIRVQATWLPGTSAAMIRFRHAPATNDALSDSAESEMPVDWMRPANVGFGLSYALPIIVAGLTAAPGSIYIIENPEAHLHPAGQSRVGHFLALLASSGVQTIIETHSEHVVNGIRLAIGKFNYMAADQVIFYFFGDTDVSSMSISPAGTMSDWPPGFFDQAEEDLAELSRLKRSF